MASITDIGTLITQSPGVQGGRPCIAGTRVTVRRIVGEYRAGSMPEEIQTQLPHLPPLPPTKRKKSDWNAISFNRVRKAERAVEHRDNYANR
jgi:uncharacterized protein (DUF433 family)